jgi:hypothetical protein
MRKIKIGDKEFTLKYSMRATLQNDCIKMITKVLVESDSDATKAGDIAEMTADVIPTVIESWYAGLIEAHGMHRYGDGSVPDKETANDLLFQLIEENTDAEDTLYGDYFGVLQVIIECMNDDGFFKKIGLERIFTTQTETTAEVTPKAKRGRPKKETTENGEK